MDPELKLRNEWAEVEAEFLAAKKTRDKDPERYAVAKAELHKLRTYWRGIRESVAVTADDGLTVAEREMLDGTVAIKTVEAKASN